MSSLNSLFFFIGYFTLNLGVKWCETPDECDGQKIHDTVHSFGYESLYGPGTEVIVPGLSTGTSRYLDCQGSRSCANIDTITWTDAGDAQFTCFGSMACSGIKMVETEATIYVEHQPYSRCWGSNACANSNWKNTKRTDKTPSFGCEADRSCADSNFYGFASIVGWGSWSLEGANIESKGDLYAEFHGYRSGYNATVICNSGDSCHIKCWGSACTGTQIVCHGTCNKEYVTNHNQDIPSVDTNLVNSGEITITTNRLCDETKAKDASIINATDIFPPTINGNGVPISSSEALCCRAAWSCENANIYIEGEDVRDVPIVCSGRSACAGSIITNTNGNIYCDGGAGCERSVITTQHSVYCMGIWGCSFDATIYAKNVYCTGYGACWDVDIHSKGELNVYITASGMHDLSIYCNDEDTCNIYCTWNPLYGQCGNVYCNGDCNVQCEGDWGCPAINYNNLCYFIRGNPAVITGDPHITTWSGIRHKYQGQPANGLDQYYYMYPCHGNDHSDMPFHVIGRHAAMQHTDKLSGLDYLVLELFDDNDVSYVVFLSPDIHEFAQAIDGVNNTIYDDDKLAQKQNRSFLTSHKETFIGNRFKIYYEQQDEKSVAVTLVIDGECSMNIEIIGQFRKNALNGNTGRYTMNYVRINPPNCYKCAICGLFGDFKSYDMQTCDGQHVIDYGGWKNAWDERAWSWERNYVKENCPPLKITSTQEPQTTSETTKEPYYLAPDPTFGYDECEDLTSDQRIASTNECAAAMNMTEVKQCCAQLSGDTDFCNNLMDDCSLDACENAKIDGIDLKSAVKQLFSDPILKECGNITFVDDNYKIYATESPSAAPTMEPTDTAHPTHKGSEPILWPTISPVYITTEQPTAMPTLSPTLSPIAIPTVFPTESPTNAPSPSPTKQPSFSPIAGPTRSPTPAPTPLPTRLPTQKPTTRSPSSAPTNSPSPWPTPMPTKLPTKAPTNAPTAGPSPIPTPIPSSNPTPGPTYLPSVIPTVTPVGNCCKDQPTETQCVSHTGTSCVWLVSNSPLAIKYNTRCLSQHFVKMKITNGGTHNSGHNNHNSPTSNSGGGKNSENTPTTTPKPTKPSPTKKPTRPPPTKKPTAPPPTTRSPTAPPPTTKAPTTKAPTTLPPTGQPTVTPPPTTASPTVSPTPLPTDSPSFSPIAGPTQSPVPTLKPTPWPTPLPTTKSPTDSPIAAPTRWPTPSPTPLPSKLPTTTTKSPSSPPTITFITTSTTGTTTTDTTTTTSGHHGEHESCHPVEQMQPFMLFEDEEEVVVEERTGGMHYFYNFSSSETEIVCILSVLTVFIICCYSMNGCKECNRRKEDFYEEIKDPTVYSVI